MTGKSNDDLFGGSDEPVHPRLRRWRQLKEQCPLAELEVRRKWDGLTYSPARMFVTFRRTPNDPGQLDEVLWEDELNQGLVDLGVKAISADNEATRYCLALKSALEPVSLRHGQDFVRIVLVLDLRGRALGANPALANVLRQVRVNSPYRGPDYDQASEAVAGILRSKASELTGKLKYPRAEAEDVLAAALALYIDEIFHLRARSLWFGRK